jgi:hypothetical protein
VIDDLTRLLRLLEKFDDEDFQFDVEMSTSTGPLQSGGGRQPDRGRSGRDKFEAKRRVKKVNRLLKKVERNDDVDIEDLFESETPNVRLVETDAGCRIVVDAAGAELDSDGDEVVVTTGDQEVRRALDSEPESIERIEKLGTTVFEIIL